MNEKRRGAQRGEMRCAGLSGFTGRMQRIRQQQQRLYEAGFVGREHPSTDGHHRNGRRGSLCHRRFSASRRPLPEGWRAVAPGGSGRGRPKWLVLPECHIAAEDGKARGAEGIRQQDQQRRFAVASRPVSQHDAAVTGYFRSVEKSLDRTFAKNGHHSIIKANSLCVAALRSQPIHCRSSYRADGDHLMTIAETTVEIATLTGPMRAVVFRPAEETRKFPGLVLFSEIFQITGPIHRTGAYLAG